MRTRQITCVLCEAAGTMLMAAVGPALAQDAVKLPAIATEIAPSRQESLPPPRPAGGTPAVVYVGQVDGSPTQGTVACPVAHPSWWKRCKTRLSSCFGYESEFEAVPLGAFVDAAYRNHIANGDAARMVLYHYDFVGNTATLNTHGQDQVAKIAAMLGHNGFPVIVERTPGNPALAEARRLAVWNQLGGAGSVIPPERIVVGASIANGLHGGEAEIIYLNLLSQTREKGLVTGAASGFVGAASSPSGTGGGGPGGGAGAPPPPP
jgi:hypothetical protein